MNCNNFFTSIKKNNSIYLFSLFIILFIVSLLDHQNPFHHTYERYDATLYQYIGKMMWYNQVPYKDIFDHKGPSIYLWNALGYIIHPMHGRWLLELLALLISGYICFTIAIKYLSPLLSFLITSIIFLNIPFQDTIGNTESFATFLLFICLKIYTTYLEDNNLSPQKNLSLGLICALLFLAKPTYLIIPITFILITLFELIYKKNYPQLKKSIIYFSIGFLGLLSIFLGYFIYNDALTLWWKNYIIFNIEYVKYWQYTNNRQLVINFFKNQDIIKFSFLSILIILYSYKKYTQTEHKLIIFSIITFSLSLISIIIPNNPFDHYLYPLYPIILILFILSLKYINKYISHILLLIIFSINLHTNITFTTQKKDTKTLKTVAQIIDYYLKEGDTFQTLGWDMGRLHLLSNHNCSTPYPLSGMLDRINPEIPYNSTQIAKPNIIVIIPDTPPYHIDMINNLWPTFWNEYIKIYKNKDNNCSYEIYLKAK